MKIDKDINEIKVILKKFIIIYFSYFSS